MPATIFSGTKVKALKSNLNLNDTIEFLTGTDDPTSVATTAPKGSLYHNTSTAAIYRKLDAGSSTNWEILTSSALSASNGLQNLAIAASVAGSALTIALKTKAASDPSAGDVVRIGFRNATITTGTYTDRTVTGALSLTISSGSTLGHSNGNDHYIYVYAIDNAGTVVLGASSVIFEDGSLVSTTAEGGAGGADSNRVMYSAAGLTDKPCRLIGRLKSNQATAGTWASAISEISLMPFDIQTISARYASTTGQTINNSVTSWMETPTKIHDTHNMYQAAVGSYTAASGTWATTQPGIIVPRAGKYIIRGHYRFSASISGNAYCTINVNGSAASAGPANNFSAAGDCGNHVTDVLNLAAGDLVQIAIFQVTGGNRVLDNSNAVFNILSVSRLAGL